MTHDYVSTVHADISKAQGDTKHQFSHAIQLAINITRKHNSFDATTNDMRQEHEELKRLVAAQRSELQQAQDLAKELSKSHSRILKQFGSKDEVKRLIAAKLEMLEHRIDGLDKVDADISSKTQPT